MLKDRKRQGKAELKTRLIGSQNAVLLATLGRAGPDTLLRTTSLACMVLPVEAVPLRNHAASDVD